MSKKCKCTRTCFVRWVQAMLGHDHVTCRCCKENGLILNHYPFKAYNTADVIKSVCCPHSGTFRDIQGHSGTFRDIQGHSGTFGDIQGYSGTFRWSLVLFNSLNLQTSDVSGTSVSRLPAGVVYLLFNEYAGGLTFRKRWKVKKCIFCFNNLSFMLMFL